MSGEDRDTLMTQLRRQAFHWRKRIGQRVQYHRFAASVRPDDVFIVSYPKSGTTWLAFLVANVLKGEGEEVNLRNSVGYVPDVNRLYLKRKGALGPSVAELAAMKSPRFFKVHVPYDATLPGVVYVLRDPRDVLVSYWHYDRFTTGSTASLQAFIEQGGQWPCEWDAHAAGWLLENRHPRQLVVRYEDLHDDAAGVLTRVLDFAGLPHDADTVERAVRASDFRRMRAIEDRVGPAEDVADEGERFVRKGRVGGWRDEMDAEALRCLETRYGAVMQALGYGPVSV